VVVVIGLVLLCVSGTGAAGGEHPRPQQHEAQQGGGGVGRDQRGQLGRPARVAGAAFQQAEGGGGHGQAQPEHDQPLQVLAPDTRAAGDAEGEAAVGRGVGHRGHQQGGGVGGHGPGEGPQQPEQAQVGQGRDDPDGGEAGQLAAGHPGHAAQVVQGRPDQVDAAVGVLDPVHRDLVDAQALVLGGQQQLGVEEPGLVLDGRQQGLHDLGAAGLEAALGVGEAGPHGGAQQQVVAARDQLAPGPPDHRGPVGQPGADGQVAVARQQGRDQRQQRLQAGGQVHVHVGDHVGVAGAPDLAQGPAPALLGQVDGPDLREPLGQPLGQQPGGVGAGVVGDGDPEGEREVGRQVGVEAPDAGLEHVLLVVHGHHDLDHPGVGPGRRQLLG
jgi:hypothetical protein